MNRAKNCRKAETCNQSNKSTPTFNAGKMQVRQSHVCKPVPYGSQKLEKLEFALASSLKLATVQIEFSPSFSFSNEAPSASLSFLDMIRQYPADRANESRVPT